MSPHTESVPGRTHRTFTCVYIYIYIYKIEVTRRRGRRRKKLLDELTDRREYCQLKEEALDRAMWRNRFGRGFGPVV